MKTNVVLMTISPGLAEKWLAAASSSQRTISSMTVNRYARDMERWEVNGETVKFSGDIGVGLVDGRHRLSACVQSGTSFTTYVATYITTFADIDIGRRRTLSDAIHMFGNDLSIPCSLALDGAVNLLLTYAKESTGSAVGYGFSGLMSHREKLDFILKNKILAEILPQSTEYLVPKTPLRPSIALTICWLATLAGLDLNHVHAFLRGVRDGADLSNGTPALAYRNFLLNSNLRRRQVSGREAFRAAISALNYHLAGKCMKVCKTTGRAEISGAEPDRVLAALGI